MRALIAAFCLVSTLAMTSAPAQAANPTGTITHLSGTLSARQPDGSVKLLGVQSAVFVGEVLSTAAGTYARLKFQDGGEVVLRPDTQFRIDQYSYQADRPEADNVMVSLLKGGLRAVTGLLGKRNPERVNFSAKTATVGIRGTHFGLLFCSDDCANIPTVSGQTPANGLHIDVAQGAVMVSNGAGRQEFTAGQFGYVQNASTPPIANPQPVQVTMPTTISQNNTRGNTVGTGGNAACTVSN